MKFLLIASLSLVLVSCASKKKVKISAVEPAQEDQMTGIRTLTFIPFENDRIGVGGVIEGAVGNYSLDGTKPYFKVVDRRNINHVLAEQALSASWAVNPKERVRVGQMTGAQGIFTGQVLSADSSQSNTTSSRSRCAATNNKGHCTRYESYNVTCQNVNYTLSVLVKLVDSSTGNSLYTNTFADKAEYQKCPDYGHIPSGGEVMAEMARKISTNLLSKIAPTKYLLEVNMLEDLKDVEDPTDMQEELFKSGIKFADAGRADKALDIFKRLGESLQWKSYVANFNYAVMLEASGDLLEAQKYYKAADEITTEPNEEVSKGVERIAQRLLKHERLAGQLKARE